MINSLSIGTTSTRVVSFDANNYTDVLIYNNSANIVYVNESAGQGTADGIPLEANGGFYKDRWNDRDLYLIADGATSDVRITFVLHSKPSKVALTGSASIMTAAPLNIKVVP